MESINFPPALTKLCRESSNGDTGTCSSSVDGPLIIIIIIFLMGLEVVPGPNQWAMTHGLLENKEKEKISIKYI